MASNVLTGAYRVFFSTHTWSASQVDDAVSGTIPSNITWRQIFTKGDLRITFNRELLELSTDQEGVRKIQVASPETVEIEIPIADISYDVLVKYFQINPTDTATAGQTKVLKGSYKGTELSEGFTVLVYHTAYDPDNLTDNPRFGTGSDPQAMLFFKCSSGAGVEINYTPDAQKVMTLRLKALSVDGNTNKGVLGAVGTFQASS